MLCKITQSICCHVMFSSCKYKMHFFQYKKNKLCKIWLIVDQVQGCLTYLVTWFWKYCLWENIKYVIAKMKCILFTLFSNKMNLIWNIYHRLPEVWTHFTEFNIFIILNIFFLILFILKSLKFVLYTNINCNMNYAYMELN